MPVREPKGRMMVREYFADRDWMTSFDAAEREWMMGVAQFADDAGYLQWDPDSIAAVLYRYEPLQDRELKIRTFAAKFAESGRFVELPCGRHAHMPRVEQRPRGMRHEYGVREEHRIECTPSAVESSRERSTTIPIHTSPNHTRAPARETTRSRSKKNGDDERRGGPEHVGALLHETPEQKATRLRAKIADPAISPAIREAAEAELARIQGQERGSR